MNRSGFTLLEMLVVLAMLALAMGVAVPQIGRWIEAAEHRGWRADLLAHLNAQPLQAYLAGEERVLDVLTLRRDFPPPTDVALRLEPDALRYGANGNAQGGYLQVQLGELRETWRIEPITGRVLASKR